MNRSMIRRIITAGAALFALAFSCDDPVVDDRPDDRAQLLFNIEADPAYEVGIGQPSVCPNGQHLCFVYSLTNTSQGGDQIIYLALYDLSTGEISVLLEDTEIPYTYASISPDGTRIMYNYGYDVYIYTLADGNEERVTPGDSWYIPLDWGPGNDSVTVIEVNVPNVESRVWEVELNTLGMTHCFDTFGDIYGKFSPSYDRLLLSVRENADLDNYYEIRLYDTVTWEYELLFECMNYGYIGSGDWSSDGKEVLLIHKEAPFEEFLRVYDVDSGEIKYATWTPRHNSSEGISGWTTGVQFPVWSVDERVIYYGCGLSTPRIWTVDSP